MSDSRRRRGLQPKQRAASTPVVGIPGGKEREKEAERMFEEILAEIFPNMMNVNFQEAQ